jgi:hypothetical protein
MGEIKTSDYIPEGTFEADLSDQQKAAIIRSITLGRQIQEDFPEVAEDYRNAESSLSKIVEKYGLTGKYGVKYRVAETALLHALRGYDGHMRIAEEEPYSGLIANREEAKQIGVVHNSESARVTGKQMVEEQRGIFGLSKERRSEIGQESGKKQFERGIGIHAQTPAERREIGRLGAISQGKLPYSDEEIAYIRELAKNPFYQRRSSINAMKISEEVNRKFHDGVETRTPEHIKKIFFRNKNKE